MMTYGRAMKLAKRPTLKTVGFRKRLHCIDEMHAYICFEAQLWVTTGSFDPKLRFTKKDA
jgi:hypothetical protein